VKRAGDRIAIWALTAEGVALGRRLRGYFADSRLFCRRGSDPKRAGDRGFDRLRDVLPEHFNAFGGHIFIMAAGIVVRSVAGLLRHKTLDPAVVVVDERGRHAVSLVSGHLGGANDLARRIGEAIGAVPVITTATDLHGLPAIDVIARQRGLTIENPDAIRHVNMALLEGRPIALHDPHDWLPGVLPERSPTAAGEALTPAEGTGDGVWVDDIRIDLPAQILVLRPPSLFVGVGCNRGTPAAEIREMLDRVLDTAGLAATSLAGLATIDVKRDEAGLLALAEALARPLQFYSRASLGTVAEVPSPSAMVEKHVGVKSVCEAAALLASGNGRLIVPKQISPNVTIAVARSVSPSSG